MSALPLAEFLDVLRARNLGVGLHEHMAVGKLLHHWSATNRDELRNALAALIARHDDEVAEIRRLFDECFPVAPITSEVGPQPSTRAYSVVDVVRNRYTWIAAVAILALLAWAALSVRAAILAPLPSVARPILVPVPNPLPTPIVDPGPGFRGFVETLGEPPAIGVPAPPARRDWRGLSWLSGATLVMAMTLLWGVRLRAAARRWTASSWAAVLEALPGPFHGDLILKDLVTRLPRTDVEEAATVLGRSFSRDQRGDQLDVTLSLRETLRSGMLPRLIFRARRVHETVLVLQDVSQAMSIHTRRVESFLNDLRRQGIALERWWFDGDVSSPSRRPHGVPTTLDTLFRGRDDGPVMILSTGHGVAAMLDTPDRSWMTALRSRSRRVWITPILDAKLWPTALQRVPIVAVPMTRPGLLQAARLLTGDDRTGPGAISRSIGAPREVTASHVDRLKQLGALVPYPTVELLELLRQRFAPDIPESAVLFTVDSRTAAADTPFRMSDEEIRTRLAEIRVGSPGLELQAREYLQKVLADSEPVAGSAAHMRWQASMAIHRVQLAELQGTDARAAVDELRRLYHGPLWSEIRDIVARQSSAGAAMKQLSASVKADRRQGDPPAFREPAADAHPPAFRWVAPGWRALTTAAALAVIVAIGGSLTNLFILQASHEPNAFLLEYAPGDADAPGYLMVRKRAADSSLAGPPRLYRDATPTEDAFTLEGNTPVRLPVDPARAFVYQVRAPLPGGGLALSNTVWAPSVLVVIDAHPWARVTISSAGAGVVPQFQQLTPVTIRLPEGRYQLRLDNGGLTPERTEIIDVTRTGKREFSFEMGLPPAEILRRLGRVPPAAAK
jgi:hypothetical protein